MSDKELPVPTAADDADAIAALQRERDQLHDRLLRTMADFDNYRKRTERERRDLSDAVAADVVRDMLPVLDDLERALAAPAVASERPEPVDGYRRGIELI